MIAAKPLDLRAKLKNYLDIAFNGEPVIMSGKRNRNVVIVSKKEFNDLQKAKRNAEYMAKFHESVENHKKGDTISFTMEELKALEAKDWKPTEKILEFEKKHRIQRNGEASK